MSTTLIASRQNCLIYYNLRTKHFQTHISGLEKPQIKLKVFQRQRIGGISSFSPEAKTNDHQSQLSRNYKRVQGGGQGSGPPPPLENHKNIGFLSNTGQDPEKSQSYQARIQSWAIIGTPAKRHLNGVSLADQC